MNNGSIIRKGPLAGIVHKVYLMARGDAENKNATKYLK
jgi:hypothetical protein